MNRGRYCLFFRFSTVSLFLLFTVLLFAADGLAQPRDKEKDKDKDKPKESKEPAKPALPPPPGSVMSGRVTFKLPKDWEVQRPVKQGIADGYQLGIPGKEFDGTKHSANAAIIAEEQEILVTAADFSEWKLKRFTGERLDIIDEGPNWRTVLSKDMVDGTPYIIVDRFGVKGKLVAYLRLAFPIVKNNIVWEKKLVTDYNALVKSWQIEGDANVRCHLVRDEGKFRLEEVKGESGDSKPKPRRRGK